MEDLPRSHICLPLHRSYLRMFLQTALSEKLVAELRMRPAPDVVCHRPRVHKSNDLLVRSLRIMMGTGISGRRGESEVARRVRMFWRSLGPNSEAPVYGADTLGTLFSEDDDDSWNVGKLVRVVWYKIPVSCVVGKDSRLLSSLLSLGSPLFCMRVSSMCVASH